jgi:DNA polymerase-3 subunit delta'
VLREIREQTARKAQDPYFHIDIPKAKFITIGSIRGLKKESSLSSIDAGRKLFLIFDADAMNDQAANAVLKVLEEPTEGIVFLLTTSRIDRVKETIRSRCHLVHCSTLTEDEIAEALRTREGVEEQQSRSIARLANGSYRTARALLGEELQRSRTDAVQFLRTVLGHSPIKIAEAVDDYRSAANRDDAERLIQSLLVWFRDAVMMREQAESMIINADQQDDVRRFVSRFGDGDLERCIGAAERALELLARNVYLPLVVVSLSAHIRRILHAE